MNNEIQRFNTSQRMSKAAIHRGTVYLCGQVGNDFNSDIEEQTRTMLEKVEQLLLQVGSSRCQLLSATLYLTHMDDFAAMNRVWEDWLPEDCAPARACVQAAMAHPDVRVEISVIAAA